MPSQIQPPATNYISVKNAHECTTSVHNISCASVWSYQSNLRWLFLLHLSIDWHSLTHFILPLSYVLHISRFSFNLMSYHITLAWTILSQYLFMIVQWRRLLVVDMFPKGSNFLDTWVKILKYIAYSIATTHFQPHC